MKLPRLDPDQIIVPVCGIAEQVRNISNPEPENLTEIAFYDTTNPRCVVNLLPRAVRDYALAIPPHHHTMRLSDLIEIANVTPTLEHIRLAFWDEYNIAQDNSRMMFVEYFVKDICSKEYFYTYVMRDASKFAFILRPVGDYVYQMRGLLEIGIRRFEEILRMPLEGLNLKGEIVPNTKLMAEIIKIVALVDNRVKGAVTQKVQIDSRSMNMTVSNEAPKTAAQIQKEIYEIQKEIASLSTDSRIVEALTGGKFAEQRAGLGEGEATANLEAQRAGSSEAEVSRREG